MNYLKHPDYADDVRTALEHVKGLERLYGHTVFVAGATGLIGSFLTDCLIFANMEYGADIGIYAFGRSRERLAERFGLERTGGERGGFLRYLAGDLCSGFEVPAGTDFLIHTAGGAYPAFFRKNPVETMLANIIGVRTMLHHAAEHSGSRLLYVSSGEVYGGNPGNVPKLKETDGGIAELSAVRSCYPEGKRAAETLCVCYAKEYGSDVVMARPCHTFGPCAVTSDNRASAQFLASAGRGEDIVLKSDGKQERSYCYVADCVSALLTVAMDGATGEAYNIAADETVTVGGFAKACAKAGGGRVVFRVPDETERRESSPIARQVLDNTKIKKLGWEPAFSVREGVAHTMRIIKEMN